ncbi:carbohydrate ABC transporter permease [Arthrobacter sp. SD76]|uniref:carbohydrate ABC transporter permease n=1 Tax=Arthrobacter sp. SD76 TaxID=3415007 RepID=UPI003C748123
MLGFLVFIVLPLVASLVISLFDWPLFGAPEFVGLDNYARMLTGDPVFWTVLGNTLFFAVSYTVLNLVLALAVSTWLHHLGSWGPFFRVLFFIPVVTPMVANALVWRLMLTDDGVVNSFLANFGIDGPSWLSDSQLAMGSLIAMSVWQGIGYNIIVLGAGLNGISPNLLEAARIDGAGAWQRFFRVVLPMLSPSLFFLHGDDDHRVVQGVHPALPAHTRWTGRIHQHDRALPVPQRFFLRQTRIRLGARLGAVRDRHAHHRPAVLPAEEAGQL